MQKDNEESVFVEWMDLNQAQTHKQTNIQFEAKKAQILTTIKDRENKQALLDAYIFKLQQILAR